MSNKINYLTNSLEQDNKLVDVLNALGFKKNQVSDHDHNSYPYIRIDLKERSYNWAGAATLSNGFELLGSIDSVLSRIFRTTPLKRVRLNAQHEALVDDTDIVRVGCQSFTKAKVKELYQACFPE